MTQFEQTPAVRILQDIGRAQEPAAAVIRRHGMSPKSFLAACNALGGIQLLTAKGQLSQAFQARFHPAKDPRS